MLLNNLRKSNSIKIFILFIFFIFSSCKNEDNIEVLVFKNGSKIDSYLGSIYTTKYGGVNYFISNDPERERFFKTDSIDSLIIKINNKKYVSKPLIRKAFSRERNDSDFSFDINETEYRVIPDTITKMKTLLLFSERTNLEKLKEQGKIQAKFIE